MGMVEVQLDVFCISVGELVSSVDGGSGSGAATLCKFDMRSFPLWNIREPVPVVQLPPTARILTGVPLYLRQLQAGFLWTIHHRRASWSCVCDHVSAEHQ